MKMKALYLKADVNPFEANYEDYQRKDAEIPLALLEDEEQLHTLAEKAAPEGYLFCNIEPLKDSYKTV